MEVIGGNRQTIALPPLMKETRTVINRKVVGIHKKKQHNKGR